MNLHGASPSNKLAPKWLWQMFNVMLSILGKILGFQVDSVANAAGLTLVDDEAIPDGSGKFVRTVKDTFHLDKTSAAVVDGITVVATGSGTGRWIRDLQPNAVWGSQATWYVDPLTGDDENLGTTDVTALATFAEARRRIEPIGVLVPMTIYVVSSLAADDLVGMNCGGDVLTIQGLPTVVFTGELSNWSKDAAANDPGHIDDATWTIADHIHEHVRFTDGPANGRGCWILADDGVLGARVSTVLTPAKIPSASATPVIGDAFVVETFPSVTFEALIAYAGSLVIKTIASDIGTASYHDSTETAAIACKIVLTTNNQVFASDVLGRFNAYPGSTTFVYGGAYASLFVGNSEVNVYHSTQIDASIGAFGGLSFGYAGRARFLSDVYFFGVFAECLTINSGAELRIDGYRFRGDNTGSTRFASIYNNVMIQSYVNDHSVVVSTALLGTLGVTIDLKTDVPLYDPHYDIRVGMNATKDAGAIGSIKAGIKGNITVGAATYYALSDLTESATDIMAHLVTNRSFARNLRVHLNGNTGADNIAITVLVNGVASTITIPVITGGTTDADDLLHAVLVNPGDLISFEVIRTGVAGLPGDLSISLECG